MSMQDLEKQLAIYCQELGFLVINAKKMNARMAYLEAEIEKLDQEAGKLKQQTQAQPAQEAASERPNN